MKHNYNSLKSTDEWGGSCFEILGFDVLISESLKPYVLEVNSSPSFGTDSALDMEVKAGLVRDSFQLMDFTLRRKVKIIKEERKKMEKRMISGTRQKMTERDKLIKKCLFIKATEDKMIKAKGNFGEFEKIFGVEEYLHYYSKHVTLNNKSSLLKKKMSCSVIKTSSMTLKKIEKSKSIQKKLTPNSSVLFQKDDLDKQSCSPSIDEGDCLGLDNCHKIFEFMNFAELFEKKIQTSKTKKSSIGQEISNNQETKVECKPLTPSIIKKSNFRIKSFQLKKMKSCNNLKKQLETKLDGGVILLQKIFHHFFLDKTIDISNLCPMIKILFELLQFLIEFQNLVSVKDKLSVLTDFRWKRICFCRICSHLTKIEKNEDFIFIKLKNFLSYYNFPVKSSISSPNIKSKKSMSSYQSDYSQTDNNFYCTSIIKSINLNKQNSAWNGTSFQHIPTTSQKSFLTYVA